MGIRQSANMGVTIKINKTFVIEFPLIYWDGHQINNPESNIQQHMLTFLIAIILLNSINGRYLWILTSA